MLYECNPLAFIIEQAGGVATDGYKRIMEQDITELHQRTPLFLGSTEMMKTSMGFMEKFKENPADLPSNQINDINIEKFQGNIYPNFYVQIGKSNPAEKDIGIIYLPEVSNGPHLSYAIQWILFALLLPIGWYVLLKNEDKN